MKFQLGVIFYLELKDWLNICSQLTIAVTSVILAYYAYKTYLKPPFQIDEVDENTTTIFETNRQRTQLRFNNVKNTIDCYLYDKKTKQDDLKWSIDKTEAIKIMDKSLIFISDSYKPQVGTVTIGVHRNWFYSKKLFPDSNTLRIVISTYLEKL